MLWRIRVRGAMNSRGLDDIFDKTVPKNQVNSIQRKQQATSIIANASSDPALWVKRSVRGIPNMLFKLEARFEPKPTASKISRVSKQISVRHTSLRDDVAKLTDRLPEIMR